MIDDVLIKGIINCIYLWTKVRPYKGFAELLANLIGINPIEQYECYEQAGEYTFQQNNEGEHIRVEVAAHGFVLHDPSHKIRVGL